MLHLEYGMAATYTSGSGIPAIFAGVQTYESAAQVTAGSPDDWVGIVGVRVGIMAQGDSFNSSGTRGNVAQQSLQGTWTLGSNPTTKYAPQYPSAAAAALLQHTVYTTLGNLRNQIEVQRTMMKNIVNWRAQRGATLFVGLMFLLILTLVALITMQGTTLELRMATNGSQQVLAFQLSEILR